MTDFHTVNAPGIKWTSAPTAAPSDPVTIALLSSPDLDTRTLSELRWAGRERRVNASNVTVQDANGDGRDDLVLRGTVAELGLELGKQIVCAAGVLPDENPVLTCTPVTLAAAPEPTPTPTEPDPIDEPSDSADPPTDEPSARADTSTSRGSLTRQWRAGRVAAAGRSLDHGGCRDRAGRGEETQSAVLTRSGSLDTRGC